jgi:hypothetical protein
MTRHSSTHTHTRERERERERESLEAVSVVSFDLEALDEQARISCKEFILAFAHCLGYGEQDGVAEVA